MSLVGKLTLNPINPRTIGKVEFERLKKSILNFPDMLEKRPVIYDENDIILGGNMRYRVLQELEKEGFEVKDEYFVSTKGWTDEQKREFVIKDNLSDGAWDMDVLANEWSDLPLADWGVPDTNWENEVVEDEAPEVSSEPAVSQLGEVYQLGRHRLMCGDATKIEDVEKLMDRNNIKTIFTSPPYNMNEGMYENYQDNLKSQEYIDFNLNTINVWKKHLEGYLFWNISYNKNARWEFLEIMYRIVKETGFRFLEMIVWDKGHAMPITSKDMLTREYEDILLVGSENQTQQDIDLLYVGTKYKRANFYKNKFTGSTNYWRIVPNQIQRGDHSAIYPVKLPAKGIYMTTVEKDIVADPFGGSGSTLIACEQTNRICYMMELDEKYCDVIRKRYYKFTHNDNEEGWQEGTPVVLKT